MTDDVALDTRADAPRPRRRGPIGRLDVDTIARAGLTLAARDGVSAITVRELGKELRADPSAIYRHVGSKDGLMRILLDRLTGMIRAESADEDDWRRFLLRNAEATLDVYLRYPAIGAEALHLSTGGENELGLVESILQAFRDAGLDRSQAAHYYGIYSLFVLSFAGGAAAVRARATEPDDGLWIELPQEVDADRHPRLAETRDSLSELTDIEAFRSGLDLILDSAAGAAREGAAREGAAR
ncbi:TetR/AcrR family transcriptional regulator [Leifsonia sp. NPDC077715]|uniref:TetR/AcrR family transcriptional regulator n=1 Tax=Leifsonia sp. NPDC077715 TaxID=3155539 RepID=UPI00343069EE